MYNWISYEICTHPWNYHHNQDNEHMRYSQKFSSAYLQSHPPTPHCSLSKNLLIDLIYVLLTNLLAYYTAVFIRIFWFFLQERRRSNLIACNSTLYEKGLHIFTCRVGPRPRDKVGIWNQLQLDFYDLSFSLVSSSFPFY